MPRMMLSLQNLSVLVSTRSCPPLIFPCSRHSPTSPPTHIDVLQHDATSLQYLLLHLVLLEDDVRRRAVGGREDERLVEEDARIDLCE